MRMHPCEDLMAAHDCTRRILDSMSGAKPKSLPLFMTPQVMGKKRSAVTGKKGAARGVDVIWDDVAVPSALVSGSRNTRRVVTSPGPCTVYFCSV